MATQLVTPPKVYNEPKVTPGGNQPLPDRSAPPTSGVRSEQEAVPGSQAAPSGAATGGPDAPGSTQPSHDDIARRAHEIFIESGRISGRCTENWLQAERELSGKQ